MQLGSSLTAYSKMWQGDVLQKERSLSKTESKLEGLENFQLIHTAKNDEVDTKENNIKGVVTQLFDVF